MTGTPPLLLPTACSPRELAQAARNYHFAIAVVVVVVVSLLLPISTSPHSKNVSLSLSRFFLSLKLLSPPALSAAQFRLRRLADAPRRRSRSFAQCDRTSLVGEFRRFFSPWGPVPAGNRDGDRRPAEAEGVPPVPVLAVDQREHVVLLVLHAEPPHQQCLPRPGPGPGRRPPPRGRRIARAARRRRRRRLVVRHGVLGGQIAPPRPAPAPA